MGPICYEWYSQSDRQKILEIPWSVLDLTPWPENPGYRTHVWDKAFNEMIIERYSAGAVWKSSPYSDENDFTIKEPNEIYHNVHITFISLVLSYFIFGNYNALDV